MNEGSLCLWVGFGFYSSFKLLNNWGVMCMNYFKDNCDRNS